MRKSFVGARQLRLLLLSVAEPTSWLVPLLNLNLPFVNKFKQTKVTLLPKTSGFPCGVSLRITHSSDPFGTRWVVLILLLVLWLGWSYAVGFYFCWYFCGFPFYPTPDGSGLRGPRHGDPASSGPARDGVPRQGRSEELETGSHESPIQHVQIGPHYIHFDSEGPEDMFLLALLGWMGRSALSSRTLQTHCEPMRRETLQNHAFNVKKKYTRHE